MTETTQPNADLPHVVVLGAGPAGVGAAYELTRNGRARVTVIEQRDTVGGMPAAFNWMEFGWTTVATASTPLVIRES